MQIPVGAASFSLKNDPFMTNFMLKFTVLKPFLVYDILLLLSLLLMDSKFWGAAPGGFFENPTIFGVFGLVFAIFSWNFVAVVVVVVVVVEYHKPKTALKQ